MLLMIPAVSGSKTSNPLQVYLDRFSLIWLRPGCAILLPGHFLFFLYAFHAVISIRYWFAIAIAIAIDPIRLFRQRVAISIPRGPRHPLRLGCARSFTDRFFNWSRLGVCRAQAIGRKEYTELRRIFGWCCKFVANLWEQDLGSPACSRHLFLSGRLFCRIQLGDPGRGPFSLARLKTTNPKHYHSLIPKSCNPKMRIGNSFLQSASLQVYQAKKLA